MIEAELVSLYVEHLKPKIDVRIKYVLKTVNGYSRY